MKYWCEIRTHGVNDAMTRVMSRESGIHRGILAGCELFDFFRKVMTLEEYPKREKGSGTPVVIHVSGPQGKFTVRRDEGILLLEESAQRISALTAALVVSGVLKPRQTTLAA